MTDNDLTDALAWVQDVVIVGDSFDGPSITHSDGTVVHYPVRSSEELGEG